MGKSFGVAVLAVLAFAGSVPCASQESGVTADLSSGGQGAQVRPYAPWGDLAKLTGWTWSYRFMGGPVETLGFAWIVPGQRMRVVIGGTSGQEATLDPATGKVHWKGMPGAVDLAYDVQADGTMLSAPIEAKGELYRVVYRVLDSNSFERVSQRARNGEWKNVPFLRAVYKRHEPLALSLADQALERSAASTGSATAPSGPAAPLIAAPESSVSAPERRTLSAQPVIIVSKTAPPPVFREAAPPAQGTAAPARIVSGSREDEMQRQVQARRQEVAAQQAAEAERQRLAAIAAQQAAREEAERQRQLRQAERQREADRAAMWGTVVQGVSMMADAYVQAESERAWRQSELDRLAYAAAEETRQNKQRAAEQAAAAQYQRDIEHARRVTEAQFEQGRQFEARQQAQDQQRAQTQANESAQREAAQRQRAEQQAEQQRRDADKARAEREAEQLRLAEERATRERVEREKREAARAAAEAERNRLIDYPEVIVLCSREGPQGERGNWRCQGGLQTTYAKLDTPEAVVPLGQACGTNAAPRELGATGGYRAFGCGFGMVRGGIGAYEDPAARLGVGFVPNRTIFRCPASQSANSCRSR